MLNKNRIISVKMKGTKKEKLSLKKGSKASKEKVLKQVLSMPIDLNETCDFKQPMKMKNQPIRKSKAGNTKLLDKDETNTNEISSVEPCRNVSESLGLDTHNDSLPNLTRQRKKSEAKESKQTQNLGCHLCNGSFAREVLQKHILNCMKQRYQYRRNEDNSDKRINGDDILAKREEKQKELDLIDDECFFCQFCQKKLSHMNSQRKTQHINRCVDKEEEIRRLQEEEKNALETAKTAVLDCPLCGKHLKTDTSRKTHLKKCASSLSVPIDQMLQLVRKQEEEHRATLEAGILPTNIRKTRAKPNVQGRKRKIKQPKSQLDEEIQIAMAISTSMAEEQKRQEKELCGELQTSRTSGNTEVVKKSKKMINGKEPLLLQLTWEEKNRRLEERVNMLLLRQEEDSDEDVKSTPELRESQLKERFKRPFTNPVSTESLDSEKGLWQRSSLVGDLHDETHLYYVSSLMPPIRVSTLKTGSKMKRYSEIPGRRRSCDVPVKEQLPVNGDDIEEEEVSVCTQTAMVLAELAEDAENENEIDLNINSTLQPSGFCPENLLEIPQEDLPAAGKNLKRNLIALVDNPLCSDIQIITGDGDKLYAHTLLLSVRSPKLLELVENGEIQINDMCSDAVVSVLKYIYAGDICLTQSILDPVISLAERFHLIELQNIGEKVRDLNADSEAVTDINSPLKQRETNMDDIVKAVWSESDSDSDADQENDNKMIWTDYDIMCIESEKIRRMNSHNEIDDCNGVIADHADVVFHASPSNEDHYMSVTNKPENVLDMSSDILVERLEMNSAEEQITVPAQCSFGIDEQNSDGSGEERAVSSQSGECNSKWVNSEAEEKCDLGFTSDFSLREREENILQSAQNSMTGDLASLRNTCSIDNIQDNSRREDKLTVSLDEILSLSNDKQENHFLSNSKNSHSQFDDCETKGSNLNYNLKYHDSSDESSDDIILIEASVCSKPDKSSMTPVNSKIVVPDKRLESSSLDLFGTPFTPQASHVKSLSFKRQYSDSSSTPLAMPSSKRLKISTPLYCEDSPTKKSNRLSGLTTGHDSMFISPVPDVGKTRTYTIATPEQASPKLTDTKSYENKSVSDSDEDLRITGDNFAELSQQSSRSPKFLFREKKSSSMSQSERHMEENVATEQTPFGNKDGDEKGGNKQDSLLEACDDDMEVGSSHEEVDSQISRDGSDGGVWDDFDDCGVGFAADCELPPSSSSEAGISSSVKQHTGMEECPSPSSHEHHNLQGHETHNSCMWSDGDDLQMLATETSDCEPNNMEFKTPVTKAHHQSKQKKKWSLPSPFTPMQNYDSMATPHLKKEVQKFGIRVMPKKKMLMLLKDIYQKTHTYETDSECEEELAVSGAHEGTNDPCDLSSSQESDISELMEESFWNEDGVVESQQSPVKDLPEKLSNFIHSHPKLYERILQYEPLEFDVLKKEIAEAKIKCSTEKLQNFLDEKCITFTMKNMRKNRNTKKRGKKKTATKD